MWYNIKLFHHNRNLRLKDAINDATNEQLIKCTDLFGFLKNLVST